MVPLKRSDSIPGGVSATLSSLNDWSDGDSHISKRKIARLVLVPKPTKVWQTKIDVIV